MNSELQDVQRIMVQNIDDVLQRGAVLSELENKSQNLTEMSRKYRKDAESLNATSLAVIAGNEDQLGAFPVFCLSNADVIFQELVVAESCLFCFCIFGFFKNITNPRADISRALEHYPTIDQNCFYRIFPM